MAADCRRYSDRAMQYLYTDLPAYTQHMWRQVAVATNAARSVSSARIYLLIRIKRVRLRLFPDPFQNRLGRVDFYVFGVQQDAVFDRGVGILYLQLFYFASAEGPGADLFHVLT